MSELNLPNEFREIEKQANRGKRKNCNVIFGSKTIRQFLQALSDARNDLIDKRSEIVALNVTLENREAEIERLSKQVADLEWENLKGM